MISGLPRLHVVEHDRHVAAGAVQVRLDHLERERGGAGRVERVAALSSVAMPTAVAIQCVEVTTPNVPSISGRVVKGLGLMLPAMGDFPGDWACGWASTSDIARAA